MSSLTSIIVGSPFSLCVSVLVLAGGRMGERPGGSGAAISPVQQMLASGTGALLTSIFGELMKTKT